MRIRISSVIRQKGESQNGFFKKTKHAKFSEKGTPWNAHVNVFKANNKDTKAGIYYTENRLLHSVKQNTEFYLVCLFRYMTEYINCLNTSF